MRCIADRATKQMMTLTAIHENTELLERLAKAKGKAYQSTVSADAQRAIIRALTGIGNDSPPAW